MDNNHENDEAIRQPQDNTMDATADGGAADTGDMQTPYEPRQVLIADDDAALANLVARVVRYAGYLPIVAANGKEALDLARLHRPALVISDVMMPQLDGVALMYALRADGSAAGMPAPPVVLMSAVTPDRLQRAGPDAVLAKPFQLSALLEILRCFLGESESPTSSG
jgi:CheY-like chemotaxis protein